MCITSATSADPIDLIMITHVYDNGINHNCIELIADSNKTPFLFPYNRSWRFRSDVHELPIH